MDLHKRLLTILLVCTFLLVGCQTGKNINSSEKVSMFGRKLSLNGDIKKVAVAESRGFRDEHDPYFITLNEGFALDDFTDILEGAVADQRTRDERHPSFDLLITFANEENLKIYLLLGGHNQASAFVFADRVDDLFWVDVDDTARLAELFQMKRINKMELNK